MHAQKYWATPGGFVVDDQEELMDGAAHRVESEIQAADIEASENHVALEDPSHFGSVPRKPMLMKGEKEAFVMV
jgi:ADP-ribose pyrophosphatase YjhB (NUDIX family)